ncbi:hypothetical protein GWI33_016024 [Rhynchophorus ferrugineus]|uniref:Chitin-binding type-2 domain-containing protein n=1 Tax=Rhynchophorus ferrugineus TaxID=354439 RepID=A0A834MAR5_RHYFE|nr:hypothetical protein GWI33_016024 [Rhynchophorus ferrugineus]
MSHSPRVNTTEKNIGKKRTTTSRPGIRSSYRRRGTATKTTTTKPSTGADSAAVPSRTPSPRGGTKPIRRRTTPRTSSTVSGSRTVESQVVTTTPSSPKITNRFRFAARRPFLKPTTPKDAADITETTEPTINDETPADASELPQLSESQKTTHQSPAPKFKVVKKRPSTESTQYLTETSVKPSTASSATPIINPSQQIRKNTIAITLPFVRNGAGSLHSGINANYLQQPIVTGKPFVQEVFNAPQTITAQEFVNNYRYSSTLSPPVVSISSSPRTSTTSRRQQNKNHLKTSDYYDYGNIEASISDKIPEHSKVLLHSDGSFVCLDRGNFPHPISCKKFISCARMENGKLIGWEYTCPKGLSFDPIGGMCNWSTEVGCNV